ncbi:hypothetical protein ACFODZ_04075 [Marinicella sediminis]|uniref:CSLREA domain-containing protein n=1 Tax=Marinicella sediminis TaxID=1792834 RepID=A0ABV7JB26_9GAMM|nr:hypothetical protein [Marinicella sediminis]
MNNRMHLLWLMVSCVAFQPARADIWVGADNNCQFQSIQSALNLLETGSDSVIKIANNINNGVYLENLTLDLSNAPGSMLIQGGYDSCEGNFIATPVTIDGGSNGPVFQITGDGDTQSLNLSKLVIKNGLFDPVDERSGGLNVIGDELRLLLNEVTISQNSGWKGGGFFARGVNQTVNMYHVNMFNNTAQNGGGLACELSRVSLFEETGIAFNTAASGLPDQGNGGGVYADSGCVVALYTGDQSVAGFAGIVGNQASTHGGGVYVQGQGLFSTVRLSADVIPVIKENLADSNNDGNGFGGGVYVTGDGSVATLNQAVVTDNAAANGGAVAAELLGRVNIYPASTSCAMNQPCTRFTGNTAGANVSGVSVGAGGAFYATTGAYMRVVRSLIEEHRADSGVVAAVNSGGYISYASSLITDNGGPAQAGLSDNYLLLSIDDDSRITLGNVTLANNQINESLMLLAFGATMDVEYSIITDASADVLESFNDSGQPVFSSYKCSVLHEIQSISGADINTQNVQSVVDHFVDSAGRDYHLDPASPAVDLCADSTSWNVDIDGQDWALDDPDVANLHGAFDAGADETYRSDVLFADDFD